MIALLTKEEMIFPNAAPMTIPNAISTVFPFITNSLNSAIMPIVPSYWQDNVLKDKLFDPIDIQVTYCNYIENYYLSTAKPPYVGLND